MPSTVSAISLREKLFLLGGLGRSSRKVVSDRPKIKILPEKVDPLSPYNFSSIHQIFMKFLPKCGDYCYEHNSITAEPGKLVRVLWELLVLKTLLLGAFSDVFQNVSMYVFIVVFIVLISKLHMPSHET